MQCARCAGMNVPEVIVEGGAKLFVMRCVHCGDVIGLPGIDPQQS
jgi:uncharacterized Zn finger protein